MGLPVRFAAADPQRQGRDRVTFGHAGAGIGELQRNADFGGLRAALDRFGLQRSGHLFLLCRREGLAILAVFGGRPHGGVNITTNAVRCVLVFRVSSIVTLPTATGCTRRTRRRGISCNISGYALKRGGLS